MRIASLARWGFPGRQGALSQRRISAPVRQREWRPHQRGGRRRGSGAIPLSETGFHHPLSRAFIRAAQQVGIPYNPDFNGATQQGVGFYQTTTHDAKRWSAATAFLRKAENRPNLTIRTRTRVTRILFDGARATGVEVENGARYGARCETALCAGAIETPRLPQLSGVGEAAHLASRGIEVVRNLPGVGANYQDHLEVSIQCLTKRPVSLYREDRGFRALRHLAQYLLFRTGPLTSNLIESGGFVDVSDAGIPDLQLHVLPALAGGADRPVVDAHGLSINPCVLRPRSRGSVRLRSADFRDPALFDAGSFSDPEDLELLLRGTKLAVRIFEAPALRQMTSGFVLPAAGELDDDDALRDFVRRTAKTVFHPAGTARMGPATDTMAVVDNELRVRGVQGLRVADASIMPRLVSGNPNAPVMMIAERASRFMRGRQTPGPQ